MKPSEVRQNVLAEHARLCEKLTLLETVAWAVRGGDESEVGRLRLRARDLCQSVFVHLAAEDELLLPLLRGVDAGGQVLADQVQKDHSTQRGALLDLQHKADHAEAWNLAEAALVFAKSLRADMAQEERDSLGKVGG